MSTKELLISKITDDIASLRIATNNDYHEDPSFVPAFAEAVEKLKVNESIKCVILEGGQRYFCAGASRDTLLPNSPETETDNLLQSCPCEYFAQIPRLLLSLPIPTIAAMGGHAIGGGFLLGLWCDIIVMSQESLYGANFMALGFTPGMGATAVLEEVFGGTLARELLFTGRLIKGSEIKALTGMLTHAVIPREEVRNRAIAIASEIAEVPREALILLKQTLSAKRKNLLEEAVKAEIEMQKTLFSQQETRLQIAQRYPVTNSI